MKSKSKRQAAKLATINGHKVLVPADMLADDGGQGPGAYDCIVFHGVEISTYETDREPKIYTGPFGVMHDDGSIEDCATLDAARAVIIARKAVAS